MTEQTKDIEQKPKKQGKKKVKKGNSKVTKVDNEEKRNITWERNQQLLQETYIRLLQALKRCPTISEVSKEIDLTPKTIKLHIKELKFEPAEHPLRVLTNDVIASIYNSSRKGQPSSQKLWMQIMEGWHEKAELEHSGGVKVIHDDIL
jgi:predicted transcriptional regulator